MLIRNISQMRGLVGIVLEQEAQHLIQTHQERSKWEGHSRQKTFMRWGSVLWSYLAKEELRSKNLLA